MASEKPGHSVRAERFVPPPPEVDDLHDRGRGFAVTVRQEIGFVSMDGLGTMNPAQAAFLLIADHGTDGLYEFPGPDEGTTTRVDVRWSAPE